MAKLTSRIIPTLSCSNKALDKTTSASIKKMLPPISAKSQKEVIQIFNFSRTDEDCLSKLIEIANACIDLGYWPSYFKSSTMVIIPKSNKTVYNLPKLYRLIILLNMIGKIFEKMIGDHLQFYTISNNFIHRSQLGGLKQRSTIDAGIVLTYIICLEWVKNLITSTLVFNIAQFFLSLNHQLLFLILDKVGLD